MASRALCMAVLFAGAQLSLTMKIMDEAAQSRERPVSKVVKMLKDMQETLEKEKKADEDEHEDLVCFCKENGESKGREVKEAQAQIAQLEASVNELNASIKVLAKEIGDLGFEVKEVTTTLDTARIQHTKTMEESHEQELALQKAKNDISAASVMLNGGSLSLAQLPESNLRDVAARVQNTMQRWAIELEDKNTIGFKAKANLEAFVNDPVAFVKTSPSLVQTEDPGGTLGTLKGIFTGMEDQFTADLKDLQAHIAKEDKQFDELIAPKTEQKKAIESSLFSKQDQRNKKRQTMLEQTFEIKDKRKSIASDLELIEAAKEKCGNHEKLYTERMKSRQEELDSVRKVIEILDSDDAFALFGKTYSFLQQSAMDSRIKRATETLLKAGRHQNDKRLISLAATAGVKGLEKVIAAIGEMKVALKKEQEDEVKKRDFCIGAFNDNKVKAAEVAAAKDGLSKEVDIIKLKANTAATEVSALKAKIETAEKEMQTAKEDYSKEQQDFDSTIADQKAAQRLLKKASEVMKQTYLSFLQVQRQNASEPDAESAPKEVKKKEQGNRILTLLEKVILDTKTMEEETSRAKQSATNDYNRLVKAGSTDIVALSAELDNQVISFSRTST
eukprot:TRINITY_DN37172_c0_g1_i2.p1 TRINITY_DN37172_c0_g1~~TRINITY_DN37172_c0_g1_i2.p1  ORF type:complete len:617 (-),score=202.77 TRINITY_DN37172_c0_g1_i2:112-1962(-)